MRSFRHFNKKVICIMLGILIAKVGLLTGIPLYFKYVDLEAKKISTNTNIVYASNDTLENDNGFYVLNIKDDIKKEFKNNNSIVYKIKDSSFYFELGISNDSIIIKKVVDKSHNINARINYTDILNVEYQKGNINQSILLKINTSSYSKYLAITDDTYYFLGTDIDSIVYKDNHFYYLTYNSKYDVLKNAKKCDNKTKALIDDFNYNDYYYKSGEINFLKDYYQKIKPTYYYVKNRCNDLKNM